jgi:hypothetical protein
MREPSRLELHRQSLGEGVKRKKVSLMGCALRLCTVSISLAYTPICMFFMVESGVPSSSHGRTHIPCWLFPLNLQSCFFHNGLVTCSLTKWWLEKNNLLKIANTKNTYQPSHRPRADHQQNMGHHDLQLHVGRVDSRRAHCRGGKEVDGAPTQTDVLMPKLSRVGHSPSLL